MPVSMIQSRRGLREAHQQEENRLILTNDAFSKAPDVNELSLDKEIQPLDIDEAVLNDKALNTSESAPDFKTQPNNVVMEDAEFINLSSRLSETSLDGKAGETSMQHEALFDSRSVLLRSINVSSSVVMESINASSSVILYAWSHTASSMGSMLSLASRIRKQRTEERDAAGPSLQAASVATNSFRPCQLNVEKVPVSPHDGVSCKCGWTIADDEKPLFWSLGIYDGATSASPIAILAYESHWPCMGNVYGCIICYEYGLKCEAFRRLDSFLMHLRSHEDSILEPYGASAFLLQKLSPHYYHLYDNSWLFEHDETPP